MCACAATTDDLPVNGLDEATDETTTAAESSQMTFIIIIIHSVYLQI